MGTGALTGFLPLVKPPGMTSFAVVAYVRRLLGARTVGHTGTLDPGAAGLLVLCVGRATLALPYLPRSPKSYVAEVMLGVATDTLDLDGRVTATDPDLAVPTAAVVGAVRGWCRIESQVPPMVSAVSVGGRRLYELAREGRVVEREARPIRVFEAEVVRATGAEPPDVLRYGDRLLVRVSCSRGTYVRGLVESLAREIGGPACLAFLVRTETDGFSLAHAVTLEELAAVVTQQGVASTESLLIPISRGLRHLPTLRVGREQALRLRRGNPVDVEPHELREPVDGPTSTGAAGSGCGEPVGQPDRKALVLDASGGVVCVALVDDVAPRRVTVRPLRNF